MPQPCHHYNHRIVLENCTIPPFGPIYSLSEGALHNFLDNNLANKFIHPSQSPTCAPILFIKKIDGSLCLAIDYCGLNCITKKDCHPLLLIPDLLDQHHTTCSFTKISQCSAYKLVHIADRGEFLLGFANFYHSFIAKFSDIMVPLTHLTHKNAPWDWNPSVMKPSTFSSKFSAQHLCFTIFCQ